MISGTVKIHVLCVERIMARVYLFVAYQCSLVMHVEIRNATMLTQKVTY